MKKNFKYAVGVIMMTLCAVVMWSCKDVADSSSEYDMNGQKTFTPKSADLIGCVPGEAGTTTFADGGVVEKVTTRGIDFDTPIVDGVYKATTPFTSYFINTPDSVLKYTGDDVLEVIEVNKPRYVRNMSCMSSATLKRMVSGKDVYWGCTFNDGEDHAQDFGLRENWICQELVVSDPASGGTKTFESCDNRVKDLKILGVDSIDAKRDSAEYHFMYSLVLFQATYANGASGKFRVKIPVWKYMGSGTPEWPDGKQPVKYFFKKRWLENKTLYRIDSFMDLWVLYSDGTEGDVDDQSIDLTDKVIEPELLVKEVDDLSWKHEKAVPYDETAEGARFEKKPNIYVTPLIKMYAVKVDRGTQTYTLKREGRPVYVSPLGDELEFLEPTWSEQDLGWKDSKLSDLDIFERTLLANSAIFTLNEQDIPATAKIELRKVKSESKIVDYKYTDFGIDLITPIAKYYTHATQWAVRSDKPNEETKLGTIGTYIGAKVIEPNEQTVSVSTWDLHDLTYQVNPAVRNATRKDSEATSTGIFTIEEWKTSVKTRTDATSNCPFDVYCDEVVTFVDKFNNKVNFLALKPTVTDKGGIKNGLVDLGTVNDQERKKMTSTINVQVNKENADYHGIVIFTKDIEKEELINDPNEDVELDLKYIGNGIWNTTAKVKYVWKLAGVKYEPYAIDLDCSLKGEAKSHVILNEAKADFAGLNDGSWSAESESYPQTDVILYTKTNTTISENYTTLTDKYTAKMQRAVIKKTVGGKNIYIKMLAPTDMSFAHASGSLVDGKRTTSEGNVTYDVWDHTGSINATVTSPKGNQTESATDLKEVWVKHEEPKVEANYKLVDMTLVYDPHVSTGGDGAFRVCICIKGKTEWVLAISRTYGNPNAADFDTYRFPFSEVSERLKLNSALLSTRQKKWIPALMSGIGQEWSYWSYDEKEHVNMDMKKATTCGIKNFTGAHTAENTARLNSSSVVDNDGTLHVKNHAGSIVYSIKD